MFKSKFNFLIHNELKKHYNILQNSKYSLMKQSKNKWKKKRQILLYLFFISLLAILNQHYIEDSFSRPLFCAL